MARKRLRSPFFSPSLSFVFCGLAQTVSLIISLNHLIISANYSPGIFGPALTSVHGLPEGWWMGDGALFLLSSLLPFSFFFFFFFHPPSSNLLSVKTARRGLYNLSETQPTPPPPTNEETTGAREEGGYVYDRNFSPPATSLSLSSSSWFGGKAANKVAARHLFRAFGIYQSASPPVLHRFAEGKSGGYLNGTRGWKFATVIRVPPLSGNLCPPAR